MEVGSLNFDVHGTRADLSGFILIRPLGALLSIESKRI